MLSGAYFSVTEYKSAQFHLGLQYGQRASTKLKKRHAKFRISGWKMAFADRNTQKCLNHQITFANLNKLSHPTISPAGK